MARAARRTLGLAAFGYACLHLLVYLVVDWGPDWGAIAEDVVEHPYVLAGATAFSCLAPLAATSTRAALLVARTPAVARLRAGGVAPARGDRS